MTEFDRTLMSITSTLPIIARSYKSAADHVVAEFGLSQSTAWPVIMIGRLGDGIRPGALSDALGMEPPSLVRLLDQLIEAGLVARAEDPLDRRAKTLCLTARGRACVTKMEKALMPFRRSVFAGIDKADIEACERVMARLVSRLGEMHDAQSSRNQR
jgi:MarR family transcriptional regulator for hemolysin